MKKIVVVCLVLFTSVTFAKVCVWTGNGTPSSDAGNQLLWSDAGNWEDGNKPANGDTVSFTEKNTTIHRLNYSLTLENFFYTNTVGNTANSKNSTLTLTGTESVLYISGSAANWFIPICLPESARLSIMNSVNLSIKTPASFTGSGEITKTGSGDLSLYKASSAFEGTWYIYTGNVKIYELLDNALGSSKATVHLYNTAIDARYGGAFDSDIYLHDSSFITYRTATLNGHVTLISEAKNKQIFYLQGVSNTTYYAASSPPAIVINGALDCDNTLYTARPMFYAYTSSATPIGTAFNVYINGTVNLGVNPLETYHKQTTDKVILHVNEPISTTATTGAIISYGDKLFCGVENVIGSKDLQLGAANCNSSVVFDMCGYDQQVNRVLFTQTDGYTTGGSITSSGGPAMLSTLAYKNGYQRMLPLDGEASFYLRKGSVNSNGSFVFSGGSTTGWIFSNYPGCDLTTAAFPNLGGIGLAGPGIAYVNATTALKNGVKLDFNGRSSGYLRVESGVNINAAQVVDGNIDIPAGVYCRTGAGVAGATEAAWLGGGTGYDGTVTVAAHNPSLVWTGAGDRTLSNAANWGANESPDLTDSSLTLDFRRANAEAPVVLSGRVAPACVLTSGDISQGAPTFSGDGTLALSGSGVATNNFAFSGAASFEWNGPGTLCLKEPSTSTGTLVVNGGKVVLLSGSAWAGDVQVAAGATLAVEGGRDSEAFSATSKVWLHGMLELGSGVEESVGALLVDGRLVRRLRTYGSTASSAQICNDSRFAGEGTIQSYAINGMKFIIR